MVLSRDDANFLKTNGYLVLRGAIPDDRLKVLQSHLADLIREKSRTPAGLRNLLGNDARLTELATSEPAINIAAEVLGNDVEIDPTPMRMIVFNKSPESNWSVPWHQDLNIAVKGKARPAGFGPWTTKQGVLHVQPPTRILENMITLRIHLDDSPADSGPLTVLPGSHRHGVISPREKDALIAEGEPVDCLAKAGDVVLMRPLLLHRSDTALNPNNRRIVHIEYAAVELPDGLQWYFRPS